MERTYCDFMDEISSDELYEGLLGYGMFADKLPPIFSSESFYNFSLSITEPQDLKWKNFVYFESMRETNIPRPLGIPDPIGYQQLCKALSDNWDKIKEHFHKQTDNQSYRVSRIHIRKMHDKKTLFEMNYKNWKKDGAPELDILIGARYIVKSDISTCFPSIYTHSIPWAIATKSIAKHKHGSKNWYDIIDTLCSNIKYGETHGLLIGPHASNLISEIILTCVDNILVSKNRKFIRNIDDYTCYTDTFEEAEKFITELNEALREFDLPINYKKTCIEELPKASTQQWIRLLNGTITISEDELLRYPVARSYLDTAISLMEQNSKNAAILKYAIKVIGKKKLTENAKLYCLKTILHYAVIYPYLTSLLDEFVFEPFNATISDIEKFANFIYENAQKVNNFEQMYYALFFAIKYNFKINDTKIDYILGSSSCLLKIFAWIYYKKNNENENQQKIKDFVLTLSDIENDFEQNWLLCYEVLSKEEIKNKSLKGYWNLLKKNKISFIKDEYQF